jgi:hypothetical protein
MTALTFRGTVKEMGSTMFVCALKARSISHSFVFRPRLGKNAIPLKDSDVLNSGCRQVG